MKNFLLYIIILSACSANAQDTFWKNVTVRKAFESGTSDDYLPATVSLTLPKVGKNSYLVNAGAGYSFDRSAKLHSDFTGFFVYNRNTLTDQEQKNYKLGVSSHHSFDLRPLPATAIFGTSTLQYLHDYIDSAHSVFVTSYWQPLYKKPGSIHLGRICIIGPSPQLLSCPAAWYRTPANYCGKTPDRKGFDFRGYFSAGGSLVFKRKTYYSTLALREDLTAKLLRQDAWKEKTALALRDMVNKEVPDKKKELMEKRYWTKLVESNVSYTGRASIFNHHSNFDKYIPLFTAAVILYPVRNDDFSVSFSYNNGANQ